MCASAARSSQTGPSTRIGAVLAAASSAAVIVNPYAASPGAVELGEPRRRQAEHHVARTGPEQGADALRARLARRVDRAEGELVEAARALEDAHQLGLGVRSDVVRGRHEVARLRHHDAVDLEHRAERVVARGARLQREPERALHRCGHHPATLATAGAPSA